MLTFSFSEHFDAKTMKVKMIKECSSLLINSMYPYLMFSLHFINRGGGLNRHIEMERKLFLRDTIYIIFECDKLVWF